MVTREPPLIRQVEGRPLCSPARSLSVRHSLGSDAKAKAAKANNPNSRLYRSGANTDTFSFQSLTSTSHALVVRNTTMAPPATEIAFLPLTAGANIEDSSTAAGKIWRDTLDTVSQQDGFQRAYYGRQVENQSMLDFFVGNTFCIEFASLMCIGSPRYYHAILQN